MPRQDFTDDEDQLLIKYLAKYTPTLNGRRGNKVYITLVEDASRRWPWAAAHPWQSWRNRYIKDQQYFDSRILRYQKKLKSRDNGDSIKRRDYTPKIEEREEVKEEEEEEDDSVQFASMKSETKPDVDSIFSDQGGSPIREPALEHVDEPDIRDMSQSEPSQFPDVNQKRPAPLRKRKHVQLGRIELDEGSDIFGSLPPSPNSPGMSPLPVSRIARPPPRVINGHFSTSLTDSKGKARATQINEDSSGTESGNEIRRRLPQSEPWPPRRNRDHVADQTQRSLFGSQPPKVDREVQTLETRDEPTIKRPKTNGATKLAQIASIPVMAESPLQQGVESLIREMSVNHGYQEDVTWRLWQQFGNLRKVDLLLKGMREISQRLVETVVEGDGDERVDLSENVPHELRRDISAIADSVRRSSRSYHSPRPHTRFDQQFPLVPVRSDQNVAYAPPETSRAARLAQRGRDAPSVNVSPLKDKSIPNSPPQRPSIEVDLTTELAFETVNETDKATWGEEENAILQNGNEMELQSLERHMGRHSVRQGTVQLLTTLGIL